jgi:hypothetical protein
MAVYQSLHRLDAVLFQDSLNTANGVALAIQQTADATQQIDVVRTIITPAAGSLHRFDLGEPRFPEPQHMLRNIEIVSDLAYGSKRIRRFVQVQDPCGSPEAFSSEVESVRVKKTRQSRG